MIYVIGFFLPIILIVVSISFICLMVLPMLIGFALYGENCSVYFVVANILWIMLISSFVIGLTK